MIQEISDGIGVIESKEEAVKSSDQSKYWKFKIVMEGKQSAITFSLWEHDAGTNVKVGEQVKIMWTEKEGTNKYGDVTYRNTTSIGSIDKYEKDPKLGSNEELAKQAPKESMKDVVHKEKVEVGGGPQSYREHEDRRQRMIVRQSALNYATQLVGIYYAWSGWKPDAPPKLEEMEKQVKKIAKEFEENVMRNDI